MGRKPAQVSADAGYCSEANLAALEKRGVRRLRRHRPHQSIQPPQKAGASAWRRCATRSSRRAREPLRLRKQLPEPVFGQIKQARGFRQFFLRGLDNVAQEWGLVCLAHNLTKLARGRRLSAAILRRRLIEKSARTRLSQPRSPSPTP